ncbi:SCAN domain-containing protein 3 [Trichinella nativa]|uniref:SCAN domain-containing protein 3 n=1 Tax=Trichinella nativa TaxID=6335 RepID=A0A0V1LR30_9BILA|nr:SCAN domain-containing protein 3 [Trichinella nativa]
MALKKRKYDAEYIKYGFVAIEKNGVEVPQCVVCLDTLSNDALRPTRLQRHLHNRHPENVLLWKLAWLDATMKQNVALRTLNTYRTTFY